MNHSIYSADRHDPPEDRGCGSCCRYCSGGFRHLGPRMSADDGYTQTARIIKAGKPMAVTSSGAMVVR